MIDVLVVGAGPAGSTAAALLARRGHRVLILDRARFPRPKPCGESINPGAIRELAALALLPSIQRLPHRRIEGWRIHPHSGRPFEGRFPPGIAGLGIDRSLFDAALASEAVNAGAELRTGCRVVDLVRADGRVVGVRTDGGEEIGARFVIGADGLRSVVLRRLGLVERRPILRKAALTAHVATPPSPDGMGELYVREWGCVGIAAVDPDTCNVVAVANEPAATLCGAPGRDFDRLIATVPRLRQATRISPVQATGPFDWQTRRITSDGTLLVGDAAGYYDPFTGEGIYRALRGSGMAARAVDAVLHNAAIERQILDEYEREHRAAFDPGRRVQRAVEGVVSRRGLFGAAATILRVVPSLADRLVALTGDLQRRSSSPDSSGSNGRTIATDRYAGSPIEPPS